MTTNYGTACITDMINNRLKKNEQKENTILITDMTSFKSYFLYNVLDAKDEIDREVFELVKRFTDSITLGKTIGVPYIFWNQENKANYNKYGLNNKF